MECVRWSAYTLLRVARLMLGCTGGDSVTGRVEHPYDEVDIEIDDLISRLEQANLWWIREFQRRERLTRAIEAHREATAPLCSDADMQLYLTLQAVKAEYGNGRMP